MARIRSIKPEFWTSLDMAAHSRDVRLFFIGLWNHADDEGRAIADPRLLKSAVFPLDDDIDSTIVRRMLDELSRRGQIVLYEDAGRPLLQVTGWRHQKIDRPQASRLAEPPDTCADLHKQSFVESSTIVRRMLDESSSPDQGSGIRDQVTCEASPDRPSGSHPADSRRFPMDDVREVFHHWQNARRHPKALLDKNREGRIRWALEHYPFEVCLLAIDGIGWSDHHMGRTRDNATVYDDLDVIFKNAKNVEKFRDLALHPTPSRRGGFGTNDLPRDAA